MKLNLTKTAARPLALAIISLCLILAGCDKHDDGHHTQAEAAKSTPEPVVLTHFSDRTELFVEFAPLTVGKDSLFAAHLTRLSDYKPVMSGSVTATLTGGGHPDERFTVGAPANPGIFKPVAKPRFAGERQLVLRLVANGLAATHDLGKVTVHATTAAAMKAPAAEEVAGAISYLKEQQWKTDYALDTVGQRTLRQAVAAIGTLRSPAGQDVQVNAPVAGNIAAAGAFPAVGSRVTRGQRLAWLVPRLGGDTDIATLDLTTQKARLSLEQATRERERLEGLFRQDAVPEKRVSAARSEERMARAELTGAQRRSGQYRGGGNASGGIALVAPVTGTVAEVSVGAGGSVTEGQPVFRVVNPDRLWLELRIAENDIGRIGQPAGAAFSVDGFAQPFEVDVQRGGRLVGFGSAIDAVTRTAPLVFELPNPDQRLRIGMAVRASVFTGVATGALAVPAAAVIDDNGQSVVYVQRGGESFERRVVQLGIRDGDWVELKSGVKAGERVVSKGAYQVRLAAAAPSAMGDGHAH